MLPKGLLYDATRPRSVPQRGLRRGGVDALPRTLDSPSTGRGAERYHAGLAVWPEGDDVRSHSQIDLRNYLSPSFFFGELVAHEISAT